MTGDDGLLVGMDAQQSVESLTARGLPQKELLAELQKGKGKTVMVVDACFSGRTASGELAPGLQPLIPVGARTSPHTTILTAAAADEGSHAPEQAAAYAFEPARVPRRSRSATTRS